MDEVSLNKHCVEIENLQSDALASLIHMNVCVLILVVNMPFMSLKFLNLHNFNHGLPLLSCEMMVEGHL